MNKCVGGLKVNQCLFQDEDSGSIPTSTLQYKIIPISYGIAKAVYAKHHYLADKDFMNIRSYGALYDGVILGSISFGLPNAKEMKGLFTKDNQSGVFEIVRLAFDDRCPKNSESRLIGISIKLIRKAEQVKLIISYADTGQGHEGIIYKATGFKDRGLTAKKTDFKFADGRVRKTKEIKYSKQEGEWIPRSRKILFIKDFR